MSIDTCDVALIGGGIMSATLGVFLKKLQPEWDIRLYEKLEDIALESSHPWNNAGTGHSALCELNYMPENPNGELSIDKAVAINEQFRLSCEFWAYLVKNGDLPNPADVIRPSAHMTFVEGESNVEYLRRRYQLLAQHPLFSRIQFSEDSEVIAQWAPLVMEGRSRSGLVCAATYHPDGTDVNFGALTRQMCTMLTSSGGQLYLRHRVTKFAKKTDGWRLGIVNDVEGTFQRIDAKFVFVGAGGGALHLLQKAGIPEVRGFAGFPVSGQFLRTTRPDLVQQHSVKVYGKASVGAPPMSVPHFDRRSVGDEQALLFGPFAGFTPKFLKQGSFFDWPISIRLHSLFPIFSVAVNNLGLLKYLCGEIFSTRTKKIKYLRTFMPSANSDDWELIQAGQRVQLIKKDLNNKGILQFGTEVIGAKDGSLVGLLGASPGASTAVHIMLQVLQTSFSHRYPTWLPTIQQMIPSFSSQVSPEQKEKEYRAARSTLHLDT